MKKNNKNINSQSIDTKYQRIETEDFYIEAPSWINPDLLDDSDLYCKQYEDSIVHKHSSGHKVSEYDIDAFNLNNADLFKNNYETNIDIVSGDDFNNLVESHYNKETINEHTIKSAEKEQSTSKKDINTKSNKDSSRYSYESSTRDEYDNKKTKKKSPILIYLALIFGVPVVMNIVPVVMDMVDEMHLPNYTLVEEKQSYTFNKVPDKVFNLSNIANPTPDSLVDNYIFKKGLNNNQIVSVESTDNKFVLTLNNGNIDSKFQLVANSTTPIVAVHDIIQLSNKDLVISATLEEKEDTYINSILHYNKNGILKKQKNFDDSTNLKNLYAQPDSENYFLTSQSNGVATIYKFTGNGNPVFEFKTDRDFVDSISIFPIKKDLYVFYSYYDDNDDLVCDAIILNAIGNITKRNDLFLTNAFLDNGIVTEDGGFLFEESVAYSSAILENKTIKINVNLEVEETSSEEFDFYTNRIFKMDNGFMSVRETVFTPIEDDLETFAILTFVKFDDYGKEEWIRHANYYDSGQNPVIGNSFVPNHIYIKDNKVIVEGFGCNSNYEYRDVNFTVDTLGNIDIIK